MTEISQKQTTEKNIVKEITDEEVRRILTDGLAINNDPRALLKKFRKETLPKYLQKNKMSKSDQEEFDDKANRVMMALGPDTHLPLVYTLSDKYQPLVLELVRRIEKEYNCQTVSEVMLAEVAAVSHTRALELESTFRSFRKIEYLSTEQSSYYAVIGKEIDRAYRRMMHALSLLKQMKQPTVEVNITSKNAFVAQNQQVNSGILGKLPETTKNENNEPE